MLYSTEYFSAFPLFCTVYVGFIPHYIGFVNIVVTVGLPLNDLLHAFQHLLSCKINVGKKTTTLFNGKKKGKKWSKISNHCSGQEIL